MNRSGKRPRIGGWAPMAMALVLAGGCSTADYDKQFDASLQQYRADAAAGRKGRAVARPVAVEGAPVPVEAAPPEGAVPPGAAPPGAVPPAAPQ